jgi:hypothetical protein
MSFLSLIFLFFSFCFLMARGKKVFVAMVWVLIAGIVYSWYAVLAPYLLTHSGDWLYVHAVFAHWLLINVVFHYYKVTTTSPGNVPRVHKNEKKKKTRNVVWRKLIVLFLTGSARDVSQGPASWLLSLQALYVVSSLLPSPFFPSPLSVEFWRSANQASQPLNPCIHLIIIIIFIFTCDAGENLKPEKAHHCHVCRTYGQSFFIRARDAYPPTCSCFPPHRLQMRPGHGPPLPMYEIRRGTMPMSITEPLFFSFPFFPSFFFFLWLPNRRQG